MIEGIFPWQVLPEIYSAQALTGFLCAVPFTLFAILPIAGLRKYFFQKNDTKYLSEEPQTTFLNWITTSLIGSFLVAFTCLLTFFWAAMRYAEDFMPALLLLSIIGFWRGYLSLTQDPKKGKMTAIFGTALAGISVIIGTLLALSNIITGSLL